MSKDYGRLLSLSADSVDVLTMAAEIKAMDVAKVSFTKAKKDTQSLLDLRASLIAADAAQLECDEKEGKELHWDLYGFWLEYQDLGRMIGSAAEILGMKQIQKVTREPSLRNAALLGKILSRVEFSMDPCSRAMELRQRSLFSLAVVKAKIQKIDAFLAKRGVDTLSLPMVGDRQ